MSDESVSVRALVRYRNDVLLRARESRGLSQMKAAKFCGVPLDVYMDLEKMDFSEARTDRRTATIMRHAETVATAFGLNVSEVAPSALVNARIGSKDFEATAVVSPHALLAAHARYADRAALPAGALAESTERAENMESALSRLTDQERLAVTLHFGLDGGGERTLDEIAAAMRRSKPVADKWLRRAIRRLQHPSRARFLERNLE